MPVGDLCNSRGGTLPTPSASVIPAIPVKPCYNRGTLATALAAEQQALAASQGSQLIGLDGPLVAGSGVSAPTLNYHLFGIFQRTCQLTSGFFFFSVQLHLRHHLGQPLMGQEDQLEFVAWHRAWVGLDLELCC